MRHSARPRLTAKSQTVTWPLRPLRGLADGDAVQTLADLLRRLAEVVEARQRRCALQSEDALEEPRRPVANGAAGAVLPTGFGNQAALEQARDGRVCGDAANARDLGAAAGPEVRNDRERLERRLREPTLDRALEEPLARLGRLACRAEGVAAGHLLEHDPAAALAVAVCEQAERELDPLGVVGGRIGEIADRQRRGRDDEQRLDRAGELVDRIRGDQAERAIHSAVLSVSGRETLIRAKGAACSRAISPALRSSSRARKATA